MEPQPVYPKIRWQKEIQTPARFHEPSAKTVSEFGYAEDANRGNRDYMEDKSSFKDGIESDPKCGIWGIYDGHMGSGCAEMVK